MKIRFGFVSNSSSSSFVIGTASTISPPRRNGNPLEAWEWVKSLSNLRNRKGLGLWKNGEEVDFKYSADEDCYKNDKVVEYMGCCDHCYGPVTEWTQGEFVEEFASDHFQFSQEQVDEYNKQA